MNNTKHVSELHSERLCAFERAWRSGSAVGVLAALDHCLEYQLPQPMWVTEGALELLCDSVLKLKSNKRGRSTGQLARFRQDMIDMNRYDHVICARDNQKRILKQVQEMRSTTGVDPAYSRDRERLLEWYGSTLDRAYECAAMMLKGTSAFGGPDAIKKSYMAVKRDMRDATRASRYQMHDYRLLKRLGLGPFGVIESHVPHCPLYELTL